MKKVDGGRLGQSYGLQVAHRKSYKIEDCPKAVEEAMNTLTPEPDCIVLHVGVNDLKGKEPEECSTAMKKCVLQAKSHFPFAKIVVSQVAPVRNKTLDIKRELFNAMLKSKLVEEKNISYVNYSNIQASNKRHLQADEIHPTAKGASILAGTLGRHLHHLFWEKPRRKPHRQGFYPPSFPCPWFY